MTNLPKILKKLLKLLCKPEMLGWFVLLGVWPLLTTVYAPALYIREMGLQLYYLSLFLGMFIFTSVNGVRTSQKLFIIALLITIPGLVLSVIYPDLFQSLVEVTDNRIEYQGRAFGLFMQPNIAAICVLFIFIGFSASRGERCFVVF